MSQPPAAIGIDFGGTSVKLGVCSADCVLTSTDPIPTSQFPGVASLIAEMARRIASLRDAHPAISAIGAGVPGFVDSSRGFVYHLSNVPGWSDVPLQSILAAQTGLPVTVENDANAMAYAEWKCGAACGLPNVICLTLGTGVGGGLILNGQLYRGSTFGAGEIGQMSIAFQGRPGNYGNRGALEKYIGNRQIESLARKRFAEAGRPASPDSCSPRHLAEAASTGDPIALQIWKDIAKWLGCALSSLTWVLNPDAIVIGGGVAQAGPVLFDPLRAELRSQLNPVFSEHLQLLQARFGTESGIIGSAALALDNLT